MEALATNKLRITLPPAFKELTEPHRYKSYHGGRGSGKSYSFARVLLAMAATKKLSILCCREFQTSIADSVHRLLSDQINVLGLSDFYTVQKTEIFSTCGSSFIFRGLNRNIQEVKSLYGTDICWVEESQSVSDESFEVLIPTIRKDDSEIWLSWNTGELTDPVYRRFVLNPPPDCVSKLVNYDVNPYFPDVLFKEMEYCKEVDHDAYEHIWEGKPWFASEAVIFRGKFEKLDFETPRDTRFYMGADWGFSQDPTVLVRCFVEDDCLYVDYGVHGVGVELDEIPQLFDAVPESRNHVIVADSARPETVSHIKNKGFAIKSCKKWNGNIADGISHLKSYKKIYIHPRCQFVLDEFEHYSYKKDPKTGEILPVVIDKFNHAIDSLRYALEDRIQGETDWLAVVGG